MSEKKHNKTMKNLYCLSEEEYLVLGKLIQNRFKELVMDKTQTGKDAKKILVDIKYKLSNMHCSSLSRFYSKIERTKN